MEQPEQRPPGLSGPEVVWSVLANDSSGSLAAAAICPAGRRATGGGAVTNESVSQTTSLSSPTGL